TEQGDLWQMLGAAFGDYPRVIAAPLDIGDCFKIIPEIFNLADRFQCPGIVLCDLLLSEGRLSVDPKDLDFNPVIDRGELVISANGAPSEDGTNGAYKRYRITESGISPRAIPGVPGHIHTAATDEHDEDGGLISDENNYSGQFARYLRSETSYVPSGYIRKYDGEPFMPHHIVEAVKEQLSGKTKLSVPAHEIMV